MQSLSGWRDQATLRAWRASLYGAVFGRLTLLFPELPKRKSVGIKWFAECGCGAVTRVEETQLRLGRRLGTQRCDGCRLARQRKANAGDPLTKWPASLT